MRQGGREEGNAGVTVWVQDGWDTGDREGQSMRVSTQRGVRETASEQGFKRRADEVANGSKRASASG